SSAYETTCAQNASPRPVVRQCFRKRFIDRLASIGLATPPCGVPRVLRLPHAPPSPTIAVRLLDRRLQPHPDQPQDVPIDDASRHRFEKLRMRDRVEVLR